jgi:hypothetical protein
MIIGDQKNEVLILRIKTAIRNDKSTWFCRSNRRQIAGHELWVGKRSKALQGDVTTDITTPETYLAA